MDIIGDYENGARVMRLRSTAEKAALQKLTDKGSYVAENFGWNRGRLALSFARSGLMKWIIQLRNLRYWRAL